jgi:DNA-binding transcriptional LysR family regulator
MDITQLRSFLAVAKHGSFTRAAEELHLSQPTVSGQIKALEVDLGVLLFERNATGVVPTATGTELLPRAERILAEVRGFVANGKALGGQVSGRIRLGTVVDPKLLRLGLLLNDMRTTYPNIEIETYHGLSGWVMDNVRRGELDFGFFVGPVLHSDIVGTLLTTITYRIVAPAAWAEQVQSAGWNEIAAMPWVWGTSLSANPKMALEMLREHGATEPKKVTISDREATLLNLVTSGVGVALMRESLALPLADAKEIVIWEHGSKQADLSFIHLAERQSDPAILAATNTVRKIWSL